jgi:hypothetical protein
VIPAPPFSGLDIGHLHLSMYGLLIAVGALVALRVVVRRYAALGGDPELAEHTVTVALVSGIIGARFAFLLPRLGQFANQPLEMFAIWQGGLAFLGGVAVALPVTAWYVYRRGGDLHAMVDAAAPALPLGHALAASRLARFPVPRRVRSRPIVDRVAANRRTRYLPRAFAEQLDRALDGRGRSCGSRMVAAPGRRGATGRPLLRRDSSAVGSSPTGGGGLSHSRWPPSSCSTAPAGGRRPEFAARLGRSPAGRGARSIAFRRETLGPSHGEPVVRAAVRLGHGVC